MSSQGFFRRSELTAMLWALRREFMVVGLFSLVANLLLLSPTIYMLQVYDRVLVSRSELTLLVVSLFALFLFALMALAEWVRSRLLVRVGVRLDAALGTRVFNASFEANLRQSGPSAQRAFADLTEIRQFLTGNGIFAFFDAPWTPIYIAVLFLLHPLLGGVSIGFALLQLALAWFGHRRTVEPTAAASKAQGEVNQFLQGKLRNAEVIESMGMLAGLRERWQQRHRAHMARHGDAQSLAHRIAAISKWLRYSQQSLALGAGALLVIEGQLSPGAMIASNVLMSRALAPIDLLVGTWRSFLGARVAFERLEQLLQVHPERVAVPGRPEPTGVLSLHDVVASAPGRASPILQGVSLQAEPGSLTVVLGPSGSGKSTLARTIVGIWPDVRGEVLLDGQPLSRWSRSELGPRLGYLPQDIELFDGSIAENIARFADVDADRVIAAARSAGLHEMILRLPKGYDTTMGEAGGLLSGGQRQRIGLARALYGDPALIVLDEPNANLDDQGELALLQAVRELKTRGKTIFLISHRPGVVSLADRLLVLRDGQVQFQGSRDTVLAQMQAPRSAVRPVSATGPVVGASATPA